MSEADFARAEAEASDWLTRLKRIKISTDELYGFNAWKKVPANAAAFARVEKAWKLSAQLASDPDIQAVTSEALRKHPVPKPKVQWSFAASAAIGLGLTVAAALAASWYFMRSAPEMTTAVGEQRLINLPDGSRVRLNTDSAMEIVFSRNERRIELKRGEAYFEVAHDAVRPFIVEAADARVRAIGTKFDVRRETDGVKVVLVQGRVRVAHEDGAAVELAPNQQSTVTRAGVSAARAADVAEAAGWTTGHLTFRDMALADAVAEVNRYAAKKVVLEAPAAVAAEPVTGEFDVGDTRAFVTAVSLTFRLTVESQSDGSVRLVAPAV